MVDVSAINIINLLLILTLAWVFGLLSVRLGYPALMGELLAGVVFGPALLGFIQPGGELEVLAELGVFLLMLYVGMEVDVHELLRLGPQALVVSLGGFVIPFVLGYATGVALGFSVMPSLFIGIAMAATSLATKSRILVDLDLLDTRIAGVLLGGALIADVGVLIAFSGVYSAFTGESLTLMSILILVMKPLLFFVVTVLVGLFLLPKMWVWVDNVRRRYGIVDKTAAFTLLLLVALLFAALASLVDLHMIIGAFLAGLFLREVDAGERLFDHMYTVMYDVAIGFFAPIFFVTVGFNLTLEVFRQDLVLLTVVVVVAFLSKIVGSWLFALPTNLTSREGLVIGLGMNGRGTVEIILATIGLTAGIITQELFTVLVFTAMLTTALVPATMKWGVDWLRNSEELVRSKKPPAHEE